MARSLDAMELTLSRALGLKVIERVASGWGTLLVAEPMRKSFLLSPPTSVSYMGMTARTAVCA